MKKKLTRSEILMLIRCVEYVREDWIAGLEDTRKLINNRAITLIDKLIDKLREEYK